MQKQQTWTERNKNDQCGEQVIALNINTNLNRVNKYTRGGNVVEHYSCFACDFQFEC